MPRNMSDDDIRALIHEGWTYWVRCEDNPPALKAALAAIDSARLQAICDEMFKNNVYVGDRQVVRAFLTVAESGEAFEKLLNRKE